VLSVILIAQTGKWYIWTCHRRQATARGVPSVRRCLREAILSVAWGARVCYCPAPTIQAEEAPRSTGGLNKSIYIDYWKHLLGKLPQHFIQRDGVGPELLIQNADIAKIRTGALLPFYVPEMTGACARKLSITDNLRRAMECAWIISLPAASGFEIRKINGAEALDTAWKNPALGLVWQSPPIAEETGPSLPIGEWAMRTAPCKMCPVRRRIV
jgi:hypothetical protein